MRSTAHSGRRHAKSLSSLFASLCARGARFFGGSPRRRARGCACWRGLLVTQFFRGVCREPPAAAGRAARGGCRGGGLNPLRHTAPPLAFRPACRIPNFWLWLARSPPTFCFFFVVSAGGRGAHETRPRPRVRAAARAARAPCTSCRQGYLAPRNRAPAPRVPLLAPRDAVCLEMRKQMKRRVHASSLIRPALLSALQPSLGGCTGTMAAEFSGLSLGPRRRTPSSVKAASLAAGGSCFSAPLAYMFYPFSFPTTS